ncbi:hypothetical protein JCM19239_4357 [Vibrio variabilis]|uniref:Uncharacterized protein n=1 Tax=Vibrio variabilis TaxID=990271 RepID=A0ABQ0JE31_9VIBR|nr:hypothetical protein JCM19239_4357 [Vibrio variabilis]
MDITATQYDTKVVRYFILASFVWLLPVWLLASFWRRSCIGQS